tara:strand:- start:1004 stop:1801 length:798 start_codon:yes stop_codon:yes gene_type:complete
MSFSLARINLTRNVKTRVFNDPAQYDTEVNTARGFSKPTKSSRVSLSQPVAQLNEAEKLMNVVSEYDVIAAQNFWAQSIVDISNSFLSGEDYVSLAGERAGELYGYDHSNVLFKPTKAAKQQFRPTAHDAMSYFVGNDAVVSGYKEDHGFAINAKKGFSKVVFNNHQIDCHGDVAHAMGTYEFTCATTGEISDVEYTFGYKRNTDGKVRICLHHSSIPYEPSDTLKPVEKLVQMTHKSKIMYDPDQYDEEENRERMRLKNTSANW